MGRISWEKVDGVRQIFGGRNAVFVYYISSVQSCLSLREGL